MTLCLLSKTNNRTTNKMEYYFRG